MFPPTDVLAAANEKFFSLNVLLDKKASEDPNGIAFRFLSDGETTEECFTYGTLARRSRDLANALICSGAQGKPVLILIAPGLEFIEGLFACWHAGAIAVPAYPPSGKRHKARLQSIMADCDASFAITSDDRINLEGVTMVRADGLEEVDSNSEFPSVDPDAPCLLQYTSGSTATPKGVMISHRNFRSHFASLAFYQDLKLASAVSWLPPYHDMGLVLKLLYSLEAGIPLTFFSPEHFVQRPARWLRAISHYRGELSGAPNFAFEMCLRSISDDELAGVDLSCWKAAPCGAERIRPETLERFSKRFAPFGFNPNAFLPGYGLAETTLIVTAFPPELTPAISGLTQSDGLVSCGLPLPGVSLRIVDSSGKPCSEREIGEIRVKSDVVSAGYWNQPENTVLTFGSEDHKELCTGDLGYLENGHLYVTGRIKDLIIIDGTNHSPEDIDAIVLSAIPEVTAVATFSTDRAKTEVVTIAAELGRLSEEHYSQICASIRQAVSDGLEVPVHSVLLVRNGLLPRTTSGKISRSACRKATMEGNLRSMFADHVSDAPSPITEDATLEWITCSVSEITGRSGVYPEDNPVSFGMSSMEITRLASLLELKYGSKIQISDLFDISSFCEFAENLKSLPTSASILSGIIPGCGTDKNVLTHSQERMWFLHQLDPESAAYHVFGCLEMNGPLDIAALEQAVASVFARHDILRSRHGVSNGMPKVWIVENEFEGIDLHQTDSDQAARDLLRGFARKPFRLDSESPIRTCLISTSHDCHIFGVCAHHIVADGWSLRILAKEIAGCYKAMCSGTTREMSSSPSYLDYAACHRQWIDSGAVDEQIEYWRVNLAGHSGILPLVTDFPRIAKGNSDGQAVEVTIPEAICEGVSRIAKSQRCTPFMVYLSAFLILLKRHGCGDDPVVAIPVANRNHAAAENLVGTLVNTLPFRLPLDSDETFIRLLDRVREASFKMQANQDAPFEKIIEAVNPERSNDHSPLTQVMFDYQEIPIPESWSDDLHCTPFLAHRGAAQFDLSMLITLFNAKQQLVIEYRSDLFLEKTASALLSRFLNTLEIVCSDPTRSLRSITAVTNDDETWLKTVLQGPVRPEFPHQTAPGLIASRSLTHPTYVAFRAGAKTVNYGELETLSNNLAAHLVLAGVKPGDRVAILLERDFTLPIALLATWKAGAAYVPLDPANPPERLNLVISDQTPIHILVSASLIDRLPAEHSAILLENWMLDEVMAPPAHVNHPEDIAYVIYTSGSTGKPKGVAVSHGALGNFLLSMAEMPGFTEADRLLAVTTISFDISALEIFIPLIKGGSFDLIPTDIARDGNALLAQLHSTRATVMQATPATWRLLLDAGWEGSPDLKILCGGEALDLPLAAELVNLGCQLWNLYGPTETTVWSTLWRVPENPDCIRIGQPIANTGIHILAKDGSLVPPGVIGELWISGAGLSNGYWNRPDLNSKAFVDSRYYTGDLARWCPDGTLECVGRSDGQVKIRGFRVELGEIEAAIAAHPSVNQAKVALRGASSDEKKLLAWITIIPGANRPDLPELRDFLSGLLPAYMLPSDIAIIDRFPLNASGKVNVAALADPETTADSLPPSSPTEIKLASIWSELLRRTPIQRNDDWFHVGGHSLLALRLFSRIHEDFGLSLPLSSILESPSLHSLASKIDCHLSKSSP